MLSPVEFRQERFAPSRECPHLKIEIWGTRFCGFDFDVGNARKRSLVADSGKFGGEEVAYGFAAADEF